TGGPLSASQANVPLVLALIVAEQLEEAEAMVSASLEAARSQGSVLGVAIASRGRAAIRLRRDDLLGAEADAIASLELLEEEPVTEANAMGAAATAVRAGVELGRAPGDLERIVERHRGDPDYPTHGLL